MKTPVKVALRWLLVFAYWRSDATGSNGDSSSEDRHVCQRTDGSDTRQHHSRCTAVIMNRLIFDCSLRLGKFSEFDGQNTLSQRLSAFTGCASQNVSPSNWQLWRIDPSTAPLRPTYSRVSSELPTWHPDDGCGLLPLIVWNFHPVDSLVFTVGKRPFPVFGVTVWNDLPLHVASAPSLAVFRQRLETFCFPVPTKTLSHDSCVTITIHHYCLDTCGPCNN